MKKRILTTLLAACLCLGAASAAQSYKKSIEVEYGIGLTINGTSAVLKDPNGNTVQPFTYNGTTYVPIRAVSDHLGASVGYDAKNNTASITHSSAGQMPPGFVKVSQDFLVVMNIMYDMENTAELVRDTASVMSSTASLLLDSNYHPEVPSMIAEIPKYITELERRVSTLRTTTNALNDTMFGDTKTGILDDLVLLDDCTGFLHVMHDYLSALSANPYNTVAQNNFMTAYSALHDSAAYVASDAAKGYKIWYNSIIK